jgi:hypothetical protein
MGILKNFFRHKINEVGLVDVEPINLILTWKNNRPSKFGVSKRLDRFLFSDNLLSVSNRIKS